MNDVTATRPVKPVVFNPATPSHFFVAFLVLSQFCAIFNGQGRCGELVGPSGQLNALVIGTNYAKEVEIDDGKNQKKVLGKLVNAENDANEVARILEKGYGAKVIRLIGKDANRDEIIKGLDACLKDWGEDDKLILFFSGHAYPGESQRPGRDSLRLVCHDGSTLDFYVDVDERLMRSRKSHRLVVLDCCHSGITSKSVSVPARFRSDMASKSFHVNRQPSYQILTACGGGQKASDGQNGHSPFTFSFLQGLKHLPRFLKEDEELLAIDIYKHVSNHSKLWKSGNGQVVGLASTEGYEGNFSLRPESSNEVFNNMSDLDDEQAQQAVAMAPGITGNWWFEEIPFFIPSLRSRLMETKNGITRGDDNRIDRFNQISRLELKKRANEYLRGSVDLVSADPMARELANLRKKHLKKLLDIDDGRVGPKMVAEAILGDLNNWQKDSSGMKKLEAEDMHLKALMMHFLDHDGTLESYEEALTKYQEQLESFDRAADEGAASQLGVRRIRSLQSLCLADYGQFLLTKKDLRRAIDKFREGKHLCPTVGSSPFKLYLSCMESSAHQQLGNFRQADWLLNDACYQSNRLNGGREGNPLMDAFVNCRMAWSQMEQWQFKNAERWFGKAERILDTGRQRTSENNVVDEWSRKIIQFHNRHGLAMMDRFEGRINKAISDYTRLAEDIAAAIDSIRDKGEFVNADETIEMRLVERLQNTLERLGDCNLLTPGGDLGAADNDFRRSLASCANLAADRRNPIIAKLLFKRILALSRPSPSQNIPLAKEIRESVLQLLGSDPSAGEKASPFDAAKKSAAPALPRINERVHEENLLTPRLTESEKLSLKLISILSETLLGTAERISAASLDELPKSKRPEERFKSLEGLRKVLATSEMQASKAISRDNMELVLFCLDFLIDETIEASKSDKEFSDKHKLALLRDAESKLRFCKIVLSASSDGSSGLTASADELAGSEDSDDESSSMPGSERKTPPIRYLRGHYEKVMEALVATGMAPVGMAQEVAQEAERGLPYVKSYHLKKNKVRNTNSEDPDSMPREALEIPAPESVLQVFKLADRGQWKRFVCILDIPGRAKRLELVESHDMVLMVPDSIVADLKTSQILEWKEVIGQEQVHPPKNLLLVVTRRTFANPEIETDSSSKNTSYQSAWQLPELRFPSSFKQMPIKTNRVD